MKGERMYRKDLRALSEPHVRALRAIVAGSSVGKTACYIRSSEETIANALTGGRFQPTTANRIEIAIDAYRARPSPPARR